ncbi:MAG: contact-dependent growth inhibition system immunity protein [Deltaproteobacteria bacterium]|nr:contact-dependent growth inhibition system immunity protein [Deltaproteobacteria bacterium]
MIRFDPNKTLDQLDPSAWGKPEYDSHLVTTCHRLRQQPPREFSVEDLRIMIGQGISLPWLMPLAVEALEADPLAEGDFYPGDLLAAVLRVPPDYWSSAPEWLYRTKALLDRIPELSKDLAEAVAAVREVAA